MKDNNEIWTTGIIVKEDDNRWIAECEWHSGRLGKPGYMKGIIYTNYYEATITEAVDYVIEYMNRMGVEQFNEPNIPLEFALYHDEENEEFLSDNVKRQIKEEAARRGWKCYIE